jgi:hypothetical protein
MSATTRSYIYEYVSEFGLRHSAATLGKTECLGSGACSSRNIQRDIIIRPTTHHTSREHTVVQVIE